MKLKRVIVSAPFGNWIEHDLATSTLGTYTVENRAGWKRWWMLWRILWTLRPIHRLGAWVNKLGLPSPGIKHLVDIHAQDQKRGSLRWHIAAQRDPVNSPNDLWNGLADRIVSIHGFNEAEWHTLLSAMTDLRPGWVELNVSCVGGATRVVTSGGLIRIKDAVDHSEFLTEYGLASSSGVKARGVKPTLVIRTETGGRLVATPDHRLKALNSDGRVAWRRIDDLSSGDYVLCRKGHDGMLPQSRGESPSFWYAVGFLYGDGHLYKHGPLCWNVAENKAELCLKIESALTELGAEFSTRTRAPREHFDGVKRNEKETPIIASCEKIRSLLPDYEKKGRWRRHGVPASLWSKGTSQIAAFLSGLFDTDGGIGKQGSTLVFTTKHMKLARDVRDLLLLFGVVTRIDRTWKQGGLNPKGSWTCSLRSLGPKSLELFRDLIGFSLIRKARLLDAAIEKSQRRLRDRVLGYRKANKIVRQCVGASTRIAGTALADSTSATIRGIKSGRTDFLSDAKLEDVLERFRVLGCPDSISQPLRDYRDNDWWFDKVKSIKPGKVIMTYDVIGSDTSSYVSSGIVSHNCPNVGELSVPKDLFARAVATGVPVIVKLPPVRYWPTFIAAYDAGVRIFHCTNTLPVPCGGLSGKPLKPVALDVVKRIKDTNSGATVIGGGGITGPDDVADYVKAGADHFAIASAFLSLWREKSRSNLIESIDTAVASVTRSV